MEEVVDAVFDDSMGVFDARIWGSAPAAVLPISGRIAAREKD